MQVKRDTGDTGALEFKLTIAKCAEYIILEMLANRKYFGYNVCTSM